MSEVYICETDVLVGEEIKLHQDGEDKGTPGIVEAYGYKDMSSTAVNGGFGGISNKVMKTGITPQSEAYIFNLECATGVNPDVNEGFRILILDTPEAGGTRVTPFAEIHVELFGFDAYNPETHVEDFIVIPDANDAYVIKNEKGGDFATLMNTRVLEWFCDNVNNIPHVKLKGYPTAPQP